VEEEGREKHGKGEVGGKKIGVHLAKHAQRKPKRRQHRSVRKKKSIKKGDHHFKNPPEKNVRREERRWERKGLLI